MRFKHRYKFCDSVLGVGLHKWRDQVKVAVRKHRDSYPWELMARHCRHGHRGIDTSVSKSDEFDPELVRPRLESLEAVEEELSRVCRCRFLYEIQEKTHGFSRGMNPSLLT